MRRLLLAALLAGLLTISGGGAARARLAATPVHAGPELDYQPALIRVEPSGALLMIIERLNPATLAGDLYQTTSGDNGATWSAPTAIITSTLNERHPALVQLGPQSFALFYLAGSGAASSFRIHRATSSDGLSWTPQGPINLGWATGGEINPAVIREPGGTLTMVYQYLSAPSNSYVSQSADGGATWDQQKIPIAASGAVLPRIARRASDGLYVVSYQVNPGNNQLRLFTRTSSSALAWTSAPQPLSVDANSHDSQPIALEDGTFLISYIKQTGAAPFNVFYKTSADGAAWNNERQVTFDQQSGRDNVQPHPLPHGTPGRVLLAWSHEIGPGDQDILIDAIAVRTAVYLPITLY